MYNGALLVSQTVRLSAADSRKNIINSALFFSFPCTFQGILFTKGVFNYKNEFLIMSLFNEEDVYCFAIVSLSICL